MENKMKESFSSTEDYTKYNYEFSKIRIDTNIKRCKLIGTFLLILNTLLLYVDITLYNDFMSSNTSYLYLFYSHITMLILIVLWFILVILLKKINKPIKNQLLFYLFFNIVIYWCVFLGLNSLEISGHIYPYIIVILSLSISTYLSPLESFINYSISFIVFSAGLVCLISNENILYSTVINSAIVVMCSYVASNIIYKNFYKTFINTQTILNAKLELEKANTKLLSYEKLRSDFFANISHELRTPLNIIYSSEQMLELYLKNEHSHNSNLDKYAKLIKQNSLRLIRLIGNLIDLTKIDSTNFEIKPINCNIVEIVENVSMSVADFIKSKGINVVFDTEIEEKIIGCDPDKIERIILNLLSNATKFTDSNGYIFVNIFTKEGFVCISIRDTGIGINPKMKNLIFERFIQEDTTLHRNRQGSGIGLSLVKSIVEMHNGTIELNSQPGKGSEFIISLPDIKLDEVTKEELYTTSHDQRIEKIHIEFSDIYK